MKSFAQKRAYIVGGSSGIGLATAGQLAAAGAHVHLLARDPVRLEAARQAVAAKAKGPGQDILAHSVDVSDRAVAERVLTAIVAAHGAPDLLVNSAGRSRPDYFERITYEAFDDVVKANLYGTWNAISILAPHLAAGAAIVNVSSLAGFVGVFGFSAYSASKFGVFGLTEALRAEFKPRGIAVHLLCPPDTDTPGLHEENKTKPRETKAISAGARTFSAERVATALLAGIRRGTFLIIPGAEGKLTYAVGRVAPPLLRFVLDRLAARG